MAADQADPQQKLETAIPEAIRLLEAKEHKQLIERFVEPKTLESLKGQGLDKIIEQFAEKKADQLLAVLKEVQNIKPTMSDDGMTATYKLEKNTEFKKDFGMILVDKRWYIKN